MTVSRRNFLRISAATSAALPWSFRNASLAAPLEPPRVDQNDGLIRLNSNENAYGPSPAVSNAIKSAVANSNRYPRMQYGALTAKIAAAHKVKVEQVLLGCGSTEVLRVAACAFLSNGKRLMQARPTFESVEYYSRVVGADVVSLPLTPRFAHDLDGMLAQAGTSAGLVYICNPNNPTASLTPRSDLESFISKLPPTTVVMIDEAYHHYVQPSGMYASFIDHPMDDERVIVTRTFSKVYGLAGLRLGYAVGSAKMIRQMQTFALQDNINAIVTPTALAALDDSGGVNETVQRNTDARQEFFNQAMARSLKPIDSHANFVMMNTFHPTQDVIKHFRENKILIGRPFPPMTTYIRVSLGLPQEMLAFWSAWDSLPYPKTMHH